jgi:hypothetical protein
MGVAWLVEKTSSRAMGCANARGETSAAAHPAVNPNHHTENACGVRIGHFLPRRQGRDARFMPQRRGRLTSPARPLPLSFCSGAHKLGEEGLWFSAHCRARNEGARQR